MSGAALEIAFDLTTSVHAGKRSAGMSRVERAFAQAIAAVHTGTLRHVAWDAATGSIVNLPAPDGAVSPAEARHDTTRVLLVTGGGWMSNAPYLHALRRWRDVHGAALVCVVHDVLPIIRPHWFSRRESGRNSANIATMLAVADRVLTYSASTTRDLADATTRLHLNPVDTRRITLGVETPPAASADVPPALAALAGRPFVLFVSTITFRKRHEFLCDVWRTLLRRLGTAAPRLLLVGRTAPDGAATAERIQRDPELKGHVVHLDDVDDQALAWCYRHCLLTTYPSLYEGWGLPVSESLAHGKVCVAADTSSLREAAAGLCPLLDPYDHAAWSRQIAQLVTEPEILAAAEAAIHSRQALPTWEDSAATVLSALASPYPPRALLSKSQFPAALLTWREGCKVATVGNDMTLSPHARVGILLDDAMREAGVAISATTSTPMEAALDVAVGGTPATSWAVGPTPRRHELHVPPVALVERAVLDIETTITHATPCATVASITITDLQLRALSEDERASALARQRIGWTLGDVLNFGAGQRGLLLLRDGWNTPATWGVWSEGPTARFEFMPLPEGRRLVYLRVWGRAFVMPQAPTITIDVALANEVVDTWTFEHPHDERPVERTVPLQTTGQPLAVTLRIRDCRSPLSIGLGPDARRLGFGLMCAQLTTSPPTAGDRPWRVRDALS